MTSQTLNIRKLQPSLARDYLLKKISPEGPSAVERLVRARNDFNAGSFFTALPDSTALNKIENLAWWLPGVDTISSTTLLARVITEFISSPRHVALLHDYIHRRSDPGWNLLGFNSLAAFDNDELYLELKHPEIANHEIEKIINAWAYIPYIAFFYISSSIGRTGILTDAEVDSVATNLTGVVVDAFDGNSFVLWWRDDRCPLPILQVTEA